MNKIYVGSRTLTKDGHPSLKKLKTAGYDVIFGPSGKRPTEEEQLEILHECVAYLAGTEKISKKVLEVSKQLKVISRNGVGIDNIDLETAKKLGIKIMITPHSNSQGVAELAISLLFSAIRFITLQNEQIKAGKWQRVKGEEIQGKTLGVIGCGNIGKRVVKMALGLGMKVLGFDLFPDKSFNPPNFNYEEFDDVLKSSDVISLHVPPSEKPIINSKAISSMKDGVYIINTARAKVIDPDDMLEALNSKKIKVYATDVYEIEPPDLNELIRHQNTICTPHIGAYTNESIDRAAENAVDNILKVLNQNG